MSERSRSVIVTMTDLAHLPPDAAAVGPPPLDASQVEVDAVAAAVDALRGDTRLVHVRRLSPTSGTTAHLSAPLPDAVRTAVPHVAFWRHQAAAIDLVRTGASVVVATGTASGKSLCSQVPIVESVLGGGTALTLYPTKALAQDQLRSFRSWAPDEVAMATFDGDCTPEERLWVREHARVLLTNPEMLHHSILSNHRRWAPYLHDLRHVVVDELHLLRGVFGTHVAQVLRRLRRLVAHYGGQEPTFVFTSATIGEPERLASELCGLPVTAVTGDAAPVGERTVALWNPLEAGADGGWSVTNEAGLLASHLVDAGLRTLVFCRSRRATELVADQLRRSVTAGASSRIRAYRAGYLPEERRQIEAELASGRLAAVVATNALELGVDIGGLDAVVLCGFPGTIASFWQQIGRCGREGRPSLAVLVAGEDQLDQWMNRHPDELFSRPPERAVINLDNPHVVEPHLGCAADELPLRHADHRYWPDQLDEGVRRLVAGERATVRRRRGEVIAAWTGRGAPAGTIGLRSASRGVVRITTLAGDVIGTVDEARATTSVHSGAVYLHQGRSWRVTELDLDDLVARVELHDGSTYTQPRTTTSIILDEAESVREVGGAVLHLGEVEVTTEITGYRVRDVRTRELLGTHPLDLPPGQLSTRAIWYTIPDGLVDRCGIDRADLPGALHAAEHAAIGILPLFAICDRWDVGGVSTEWLPETGAPTVVIHDAHPGGAGVAELAFDAAGSHLSATRTVISDCACAAGCPSCVQSPKCGNNNEPLAKDAALQLLTEVLKG